MGGFEIAISIITTLLAIVAMQGRNMGFILACQLFLNALIVLQYTITGNLSASYICALAVVQVVISFVFQKKGKPFPIYVTVVFMAGYLAISLLEYTALYDVLTGVAACMFALSVVQKHTALCRLCCLFNGIFWLAFDLFAASYGALPVHITVFTATLISIIRLDRGFWSEKIRRKNEEK